MIGINTIMSRIRSLAPSLEGGLGWVLFFTLHSSLLTFGRACSRSGKLKLVWLSSLLIAAFTSCSSEQELEPEARIPIEVMPCMAPYEEEYAPTRAWLPPTGFSEVVGSDSKSIGICFTQNNQDPKKGFFVYSDTQNKWYTSVENIQEAIYYLYGYYPHEAGVICNISSSTTPDDKSSYSTGAVLTLSNLPSATPNDMCVVVGAKNGKDDYKENENYSVTGLVPGTFLYEAAAATTDNPPTAHGNYVYLLFDHLYSCLRLQFKVDATYNSLRRIKLKKLDIQAYAGSVRYPIKNKITVTLGATNDGSSPIQSIEYTGTADIEEWSSFFTSIDGELVTTDYGPLKDCYFAPKNITKLILKSTYDIYDTNGNLIREEATAENALVFNDLFNPEPVALRSKRYTVKLTIQPTYLYVLSDPDLDNPRLVVDD